MAAAALAATPTAAHAETTTFVPCTGANGGAQGLRRAIETAQGPQGAGSGIIELAAGCAYVFDTPSPAGGNRALTITGRILISGKGSIITRRADAPRFGIFSVRQNASLTLVGVTVSGGSPRSGPDGAGGGIANAGTLILKYSEVTGNRADSGGGISAESGSLTQLYSSIVKGNRSTPASRVVGVGGGGIGSVGGTVSVVGSLIADNTTTADGGGISNLGGTVVLIHSTVAGNRAANGGGVTNASGTLQTRKTKIVHNVATRDGGGLANLIFPTGGPSDAELRDSLVAGNNADRGGGIWNESSVNLVNTRVVDNEPDNCAGTSPVPGCPGDFTASANAAQLNAAEAGTVGAGTVGAGTATSGTAADATGTRLVSRRPDRLGSSRPVRDGSSRSPQRQDLLRGAR
ncbi:hypothetical protein HNP84_001751 [Thermocatellispora tengchongensis]|uniref:Right handed beta helix domain-containing protein n=1 Tax=Thermocatellispora tengchongensis TaxID=1073253 RepID=A0A840NWZ3_9ACTN|nr:hypothetical protein [Thermocatellispora tengchongensis]MBB5132038.1 hypothetical protein [Thermocatellispora tengchongensis]